MIIKDLDNEKTWEDFLVLFEKRTFLSSWAWGEFRKSLGENIYRKEVWLADELIAVFFVSKIRARKGNFLLIAHGPLIKKYSENVLTAIIDELKKIAQKEKACFIRIAPLWDENSEEDKLIRSKGFINSPCSVFPEKSWELSLTESEDEILSKMRKGTRYLIRNTEKIKDFEIFKSENSSDLREFYEIYKKTSLRQGFKPFSFEYIKKELDGFLKKGQATLFLAKKDGKCLSGAIVIFWQKVAFYHHGASINNRSSFSIPSFIQWQVIKEAKRRGCEKYNFWVISPNNDPNHRWAGLTFFKKGFGGNEVNYAKTKDLPLSKRYWLTYFLEKIKRNK